MADRIAMVEGVEIVLRSCAHCRAVPTQADVPLERLREYNKPCSHCGELVRVRRVVMEHVNGSGRLRWAIGMAYYEPFVEFSSWEQSGHFVIRLHLACAKKVLPVHEKALNGIEDEFIKEWNRLHVSA